MKNIINLIVEDEEHGQRIDIFLTKKEKDLSRTRIKNLIVNKNLKINSIIIVNPAKKIASGDNINLNIPRAKKASLKPYDYKLDIVYEDDYLMIINKSAGISMHPGAGNYENTLVNALLYKYKKNLSDLNGALRPGIVHRIDKNTSGLLVVAKNNLAHANLGVQFSNHTIKRKYICLAWGVVRPLNGKINTLISRDKKNRQLMTVSEINGKKAITNYKTLKVFNIKDIPKISLIECELETGRTHQIRVHLKYKGASLLGDKQYGKKNIKFKKINKEFLIKLNKLSGQALHAKTLSFNHPETKKWISFNSDLPEGFKKILSLLENLSS